jgi:hypothetical protein
VITRHRGGCSPREVIVQHVSEPLVARETDIFQRLVETSDCPLDPLSRSLRTRSPVIEQKLPCLLWI